MATKKDLKGKGRAKEDDEMEEGAAEEKEFGSSSEEEQEDKFLWEAELHVTDVNYHTKKMVFLLFINRKFKSLMFLVSASWTSIDRLVESARIRKAIEAVYSGILPKGTYPFIYFR
jgi:DNA mismatch repair protein MLH1